MKLALVNRQVILPESGTESFQCHASTLVRLPCGTLVAAWFAGLREGSEDTAIWLSRYEHNLWTTPQRVAAREGEAHWNPVLFYPSDNCGYFISRQRRTRVENLVYHLQRSRIYLEYASSVG